MHNITELHQRQYQYIAADYDWSNLSTEYDGEFEQHITSIV